jgi:hypothetical protein
MEKRQGKPKAAAAAQDVTDRVRYLLETLWGGNRAKMAAELGFSTTAINSIANGNRTPGRRLLQAIADHPKVNPTWLLSGEGAPLLVGGGKTLPGERKLPIAVQPLPGPPADYRKLLTGKTYPVAVSQYRSTRYWLDLQINEPIIARANAKVARNDLLLFECDPTARTRIFTSSSGALCVVDCGADSEPRYKVARVTPYEDEMGTPSPIEVLVDTFDQGIDKSKLLTRYLLDVDASGNAYLNRRSFHVLNEADKGKAGKQTPVGQTVISPPPVTMSLDCIIAVGLLIVRREP